MALHQIEYCRIKHRTPIILHEISTNTLCDCIIDHESDDSEIKNQLEYCFEITQYDISALSGKNDIKFITSVMPPSGHWYDFWNATPGVIKKYRKYFKKYFVLNSLMQERMNSYINTHFPGHRILGLLLRGTDYNATTAYGHPIPPSIDQVETMVIDKMKELNFDRILLVTEDESIFAYITKRFKGQIMVVDQPRFSKKEGKYISNSVRDCNVDNIELMRSYVLALHLLSRCQGIICANTSGSMILPLMNPEWEYSYRFDLGRFK